MISEIIVQQIDKQVLLTAGNVHCSAAIGREGMIPADEKHEGDGKTPIGVWPLRCLYFRPDRITLPICQLKAIPITPKMGWCDDAAHPDYNKEITLPFNASHEKMWRDDHAYDLVIPLGFNDSAPVAGKGSAIFFHLLHEGKHTTAGCIAIPRNDMLNILPQVTTETTVKIIS